MGYTTDFDGVITVDPPLNQHEVKFLSDFNNSRRMDRENGPLFAEPGTDSGQARSGDVRDYNSPPPGQPGLWCQWEASDDGTEISWDGGEKFYEADSWMQYLVENLFSPNAREFIDEHVDEHPALRHFTCDHVLNGTIQAQGEDDDDRWDLVVTDNLVQIRTYSMAPGPLVAIA